MTLPVNALNCPRCGRPLNPPPGATQMECPYCGSAVWVPQAKSRAGGLGFNMLTCNLIAAAIALVVGGGGCLIGVAASIWPLFAFVAPTQRPRSTEISPPTKAVPTATPAYGQILLSFGQEGTGPGQFNKPDGMDMDGAGNIYVRDQADKGERLQVFDAQGKYLRAIDIGRQGFGGLAVGPDGRIYLVGGHQVSVLDQDGTPVTTFDYEGELAGLTVGADGSLYGYDILNEAIVRFDPSGQITLTIPDAFSSIINHAEHEAALAVDQAGNIYALGTIYATVLEYDPTGKFIGKFGGRSEHGGTGVDPGLFFEPDSIAIDQFGYIYVGEWGDVQVFTSKGKYLYFINPDGDLPWSMRFTKNNNLVMVTNSARVLILSVQQPK